jgi:signal transduction histidine kinase/DNA-binding response OmpR family regulator/ligand-binding sensor domain-containing protein
MAVSVFRKILSSVLWLFILILYFEGYLHGDKADLIGYKYFKNYSYIEYDHHAGNFCILQDQHGIIYVGNNAGILVYDGVTWDVLEIPNVVVRSMAMAKDGRIYVGGKDEFGYLAPDNAGFLQYYSLRNQLDKKYSSFGNVWETIATDLGVYFRTSRLVFRWNFQKIDNYKEGVFGTLFLCNGKVLLQQSRVGLLDIENSATPLPGSHVFGTKKTYLVLPFDDSNDANSLLVGSRFKGLMIYRNGIFTPFKTDVDDYLKQYRMTHGIRLVSGDYAIGTDHGGIVILDAKGQLKYHFNKKRGLQDNAVKFIYQDNLGSLWLALSKGISRLEYQSPIYQYDDRNSLEGNVFDVTRFKSDLYAGTTQGLYVLAKDSETYKKVPGIRLSRDLLTTPQSLLSASRYGVFQLDSKEGTAQKVYNIYTHKLAASKHFPGYIWCATRNGLAVLEFKDKHWTLAFQYKELIKNIFNIIEDPSGYLWVISADGNILKVNFPTGIQNPVVTGYGQEGGLYERDIYLAILEGYVVFASKKGLFRYDKKSDQFVPDLILGKKYAGGNEATSVFRIAQDANRHIWFHSRASNFHAVPGPNKTFTINDGPFRRVYLSQRNAIYPEVDGKTIWFAGFEGLLRFDTQTQIQWDKNFPVIIRRVFSNQDTPIYGGYKSTNKKKFPAPVFSYQDRNVSFRCAAPFFIRETKIQHRYLLEGFETHWSEWTSQSHKNYTNLNAGEYRFRVQAKNIYGIISHEDSFKFSVLPPWFYTWWAIILYVLAASFLFLMALKWRSRKLVREKIKLQGIVKESTREILIKKNQLEEQTIQLKEQSQKLKEVDSIKSRFFTNISHEFRTPLTLIMSPLEQMLAKPGQDQPNDLYRTMLRNAQRLLNLINQLLDLARIDSGKMKLQLSYQDMISLLKEELSAFHSLGQQKNVTLAFQCHEEKIAFYFDAEKIEEVMYNLLGNALKHTPSGGIVAVSMSIDAQGNPNGQRTSETVPATYVTVSVKDTGAGIAPEQLAHVFDRFFQGAGAKSQKSSGIGLSLCKELVLLHHGTIDVLSQEGEGTEFIVRLPMVTNVLSDDFSQTLPVPTSKQSRQEEIEALYLQPENKEDGERAVQDENLKDYPEKTVVLVVEDHDDMRLHIRKSIIDDYTVIEAVNGKVGIDKAKEHIPDLIITDVMMPETDGYELCRVLKKDIKTCHIPIIMLTAKASPRSVLRGLETGADDYVTKPFSPVMLSARIKNLIDLRRQMQLKIQREKMLLPTHVSVSSQDDQFLQKFQSIIDENIDDYDFNIDQLSKKLKIARSTLFKKIQALTGETPNQFIQSFRLERGAQLLRENYGNVTQVALAVGFSTPQYFARCFKEKYHQSPTAFQATHSQTH